MNPISSKSWKIKDEVDLIVLTDDYYNTWIKIYAPYLEFDLNIATVLSLYQLNDKCQLIVPPTSIDKRMIEITRWGCLIYINHVEDSTSALLIPVWALEKIEYDLIAYWKSTFIGT
jgi:hypothetical protein